MPTTAPVTHHTRRALLQTLSGAAAALATGAHAAQPGDEDATVVTRHAVTLGDGRRLAYTARAGFLPIREDISGQVTGRMYFVAYTADRPKGRPAPRPLTFAWGGGPGGPATLEDIAPRRVVRGAAEPKVEDNPNTWLAHSDLVLIDTMGTGYSRLAKPEYAVLYYSIAADAAAATEFIRLYLKRYVADDPPIFLTGQSYGSIRGVMVADAAQRRGIPIAGMLLGAVGIGFTYLGSDIYESFFIPSYTIAAQAHGRLPAELQADRDRARRESEQWTLTRYMPGLMRGNRMSGDERSAMVREMARYTGLAPEVIERNNLRVKASVFGAELLAREGQVVGLFDSRKTAPAQTGPWDASQDPSLLAHASVYPTAGERLLLDRELGMTSDMMYAGPFGGAWPEPSTPRGDWMTVKWGTGLTNEDRVPGVELLVPAFLRAMSTQKSMQVLLANGLYDLQAPYFESDYLAALVPPDQKGRVKSVVYETGHGLAGDVWGAEVAAAYRRAV
jgi:carboxypeptidase C (cathepsin A)